jgi:hypothetical protein
MQARLARALVALLLFAALQELVLRWVFPLPEVLNFDRLAYSALELAPGDDRPTSLGRASFTWSSAPDGYAFEHQLNRYGFRDADWPLHPQEGRARVAFVGDSFVEGFGTPASETLPRVFARRVAATGRRVEALNLGAGGADLAREVRLVRDSLPLLLPADVLLVFYENDLVPVAWDPAWLEDALVPEPARPWQPRALHVLGERARGRRVARRWGRAPFPYLPAVPDPRNP